MSDPTRLRRHIGLAALLIVALASSRATAATERTAVTGKLGQVGGMRVLYLDGSAEERAFAEGFLCAGDIRSLFNSFVLRSPLVPTPGIWDLVVKPMLLGRTQASSELQAYAAAVIDGMRARDAATLRLDRLNRDLAADDIIAATALPDVAGMMCSAFAYWGAARTGAAGAPTTIVARNLDYPATGALVRTLLVIVHAPLGDAPGWVSIGWPGVYGCVTGITEHGVFVALHDVVVHGGNPARAIPRLVVLRDLLTSLVAGDTTPHAALAHLRRTHVGMGGNCLLAWPAGGAVLEFDDRLSTDDGATLRSSRGKEPYVLCTNHFRARPDFHAHCERYETLQGFLDAQGTKTLDVEGALAAIRSTSWSDTIYRLAADLGSGDVRLERREPDLAGWHAAVDFNCRTLVAEAAQASTRIASVRDAGDPTARPAAPPKKPRLRWH